MNKKMLALTLAMAFTLSTVAVSFAARVKCEVKSVEGSTVTLDCGKKASKLKVGTTVKVKPGKVRNDDVVEGC
ncbi:MAG: hypothetical protein OEL66_03640 [Desulfobulbaceae bacterium]|nr:hypothetical protein [Desulfobulbaceae bacterium]